MTLLVADIGGTNARFAYQAENTKELSNFAYLKCSDFNNIHDYYLVNIEKTDISNEIQVDISTNTYE